MEGVSPEMNGPYATCRYKPKDLQIFSSGPLNFSLSHLQLASPLLLMVPHTLCSVSMSSQIPAYLHFAGQSAWWPFGTSPIYFPRQAPAGHKCASTSFRERQEEALKSDFQKPYLK